MYRFKKTAALLLSVWLVVLQIMPLAFAAEAQEDVPEPTCVCMVLCTAEAHNHDCARCEEDITHCIGVPTPENDPVPLADVCLCILNDTKCTSAADGSLNLCVVCESDFTQCQAPEPSAPACQCIFSATKCTSAADGSSALCVVCENDFTQCQAPEPMCICPEDSFRCTADMINPFCLICAPDYTKCETPEPPPPACQCILNDTKCTSAADGSLNLCVVCESDFTQCQAPQAPEPLCQCIFNDVNCASTEDGSANLCLLCQTDYTRCRASAHLTCLCPQGNLPCQANVTDANCVVCQVDYTHCNNLSATCICRESNAVCRGDNFLLFCRICEDDWTKCENTPSTPCTCIADNFSCSASRHNPNCAACTENLDFCQRQCRCPDAHCAADDIYPYCPLCAHDYALCARDIPDSSALQRCIDAAQSEDVLWLNNAATLDSSVTIRKPITLAFNHESGASTSYPGESYLNREATADASYPLLVVESGAVLTLRDIVVDGIGGQLTARAPLVEVKPGGTLILTGHAKLLDNENKEGNGGGILSEGTIILEENATISGCEASAGAGIYLADNGKLILRDAASVTRNTATTADMGGGIYCPPSGIIELSGAVHVTNNRAAGKSSNLMRAEGAAPIALTGAISADARIGITAGVGVFARKATALSNAEASVFLSDKNLSLSVSADGTALKFVTDDLPAISGRVLLDGQPVQYANVSVRDRSGGITLTKVRTDQHGIFRFSIPQTEAPLRLLAEVTADGTRYAAIADWNLDTSRTANDLHLTRGILVSGSITGPASGGATVTVQDQTGGRAAETIAFDGGYDLILPAVGKYSLTVVNPDANVSGSGFLTLARDTVSGANLTIQSGTTATGRILTTTGQPAVGAVVTFTAEPSAKRRMQMPTPPCVALTDRQGNYTIGGLSMLSTYRMTAFHTELKQSIVVDSVSVDAIGEHHLESAIPLSGVAGYFKTILSDIGADVEFPTDLVLELRTLDGLYVTESVVSSTDGSFAFEGVYPGDFRIAAVSRSHPDTRIEQPNVTLTINKDQPYKITPEHGQSSQEFTLMSDVNLNNALTSVLQVSTLRVISVWGSALKPLQDDEKKTANDTRMSAAERERAIIEINNLYKTANALERDMLPQDIKASLEGWLDSMTAKYKVTAMIDNGVPSILSQVSSTLVDSSDVNSASQSAKRIAAVVGSENNLANDAELDVVLSISEAQAPDIQTIDQAMLSGEVLDYFGIDLRVDYDNHNVAASAAISEAGEEIEISVTPITLAPPSGGNTYRVLRLHNGVVDVLDATYQNGTLTFTTDRFSTYAIAYAAPGQGVVVKPSAPPSDGGTSGGTNSDTGGSSSSGDEPSGGGSGGEPSTTPYQFWLGVRRQLNNATAGARIVIDATSYDMLPASVLQALAGKDVTLVIRTANGNITLNGKSLPSDKADLYYSFSELLGPSAEDTPADSTPAEGTPLEALDPLATPPSAENAADDAAHPLHDAPSEANGEAPKAEALPSTAEASALNKPKEITTIPPEAATVPSPGSTTIVPKPDAATGDLPSVRPTTESAENPLSTTAIVVLASSAAAAAIGGAALWKFREKKPTGGDRHG